MNCFSFNRDIGGGISSGARVQILQARLFPICTLPLPRFERGLKTTQLEVDTDETTLRQIARLKEPRDLFALPGDKQNDCSQQAPRWPIECQVIKDRIHHIYSVPKEPEPSYKTTGEELKPRPVGEENGLVVFNYNPVSAVNYDKKKHNKNFSSDSDSSSESKPSSPDRNKRGRRKTKLKNRFSNIFEYKETSSSTSNDGENDNDKKSVLNKNSDSSKNSNYVTAASSFNCSNSNNSNNSKLSQSTYNNEKNSDKQINQVYNNVNWKKIESSLKNVAQGEKEDEPIPRSNPLLGDDYDDNLIPSVQFSRSCVGGAKNLTNVHPCHQKTDYDGLQFESRFESGNLAKAVQITSSYYELYLRSDLYTCRSRQWFYFRVRNTRKNVLYRFSIVNLVKSDSLYNNGMRPLMYSEINAKELNEGWVRCGDNICYYRNDDESGSEDDDEYATYTLTFHVRFPHDKDTVFFAHSYPYTYSELQDYLMEIQRHPVKSKFCKLRLLCRSLAGNNVYYLTVTAPRRNNEESVRNKKCIVVSARVHPSETPASWMMKGLMDFITSESPVAKRLRHKFIFKLIPMLNPDGVIVGNTRNSLTGKDLNRQYRTVIREAYPSIWYTKAMIKRLIDECGVVMYCDMHAHSRRNDIFIYGCENKRNADKKLSEQVFPLMMHKNVADKFSFEACKFRVQRSKEGTGRIVVWMLGITNSYTLEASFGGSSLGSRKGTHFNTADYEHMGRAFCETLLDYCDETPNKVKKHSKFFKQIKRIRRRERREKRALKLKRIAEQGRIIDDKLLKCSEKSV